MSKIAEKKSLEAYPILFSERNGYDNTFKDRRESYVKGYDQAFQDFLEKAEKFFKNELYVSISDQVCSHNNFTSMSNFIEQFKNYMQDEM